MQIVKFGQILDYFCQMAIVASLINLFIFNIHNLVYFHKHKQLVQLHAQNLSTIFSKLT